MSCQSRENVNSFCTLVEARATLFPFYLLAVLSCFLALAFKWSVAPLVLTPQQSLTLPYSLLDFFHCTI